jgi:two-component system response regulator FlrC
VDRVLVVDDEEGIRSFIGEALASQGLHVALAADGEEAARVLERESFHLLITDLKMPKLDGMSLLRRVRAEQPELEVIVLTAHGTVGTAVEAMKLGAFEYLAKPLSSPDEIRLLAARALERRRLRQDRQRSSLARGDEAPVARDPATLRVMEHVDKVAVTDASVLLLGESGVGKEVIANAIHRRSKRAEGPFVPVNCAALSETLLESELFGHERGAFTGASAARRGRFELADGGTLFLDEVAELKAPLQAKLLRVLQDHRFERVGGSRTIEVDVRLIAATNRDLEEELRDGRFRVDLYHRLAVFPVRLPPLRARPGDILPLAAHLLARIARELGRPALELQPVAAAALEHYSWPGNVRELANALERAAILAGGTSIGAEHLALAEQRAPAPGPPPAALDGTLREIEREAIRRALEATGGHRKQAAARLGIGLRTLYEKIKDYGLGD